MGVTTLFSSAKGDLTFPISPPTKTAPGAMDNMAIGASTPAPGAFTTLSASGAVGLSGGLSNAGTVVLNGATPVTVANATLTAKSLIIFTLKTVGGTVGAIPAPQTVTPGTGFTVAGTALDTSTYNFAIIG